MQWTDNVTNGDNAVPTKYTRTNKTVPRNLQSSSGIGQVPNCTLWLCIKDLLKTIEGPSSMHPT